MTMVAAAPTPTPTPSPLTPLTPDVNSILRKLSRRLDIPYSQLIEAYYQPKSKKSKTQADKAYKKQMTTLEYIRHDGIAYFYDPENRIVYTYDDEPEVVGHMNKFMELEITA